METRRKSRNNQTQHKFSIENDETVLFDIQPALHFNVKEYRARLKQEKEERKRQRQARKK